MFNQSPDHNVRVIEIDQRWPTAQVADRVRMSACSYMLAQTAHYGGDDGFGRDTEVPVQIRTCDGRGKSGHADEGAVRAQPLLPAKPTGGFDANPRRTTQHLGPDGRILLGKQFPAWQGND